MPEVTFTKQWRGYSAGDVAELTDERAEQLISQGIAKANNGEQATLFDDEPAPEPVEETDATDSDDNGEGSSTASDA